jgi:serine/threonine protein kinase
MMMITAMRISPSAKLTMTMRHRLCGYPPFYAEDDDEVFDQVSAVSSINRLFWAFTRQLTRAPYAPWPQIMAGDFEFPSPHWDSISPGAKDLIKRCLVVDPAKRIKASEAMEHPWVKVSNLPPPPTLTYADP